MIRIEPVIESMVDVYRQTRLAALLDTPRAFGSTHARESAQSDAWWLDRARRATSKTQCVFLAFDDGIACGLAGAIVEPADRSRATLFSMWVAPTHRRLGVGEQLVYACSAWCRDQTIAAIDLMVTDWNTGAITFYERMGFKKTGRTEPYPNDPALLEIEMCKGL